MLSIQPWVWIRLVVAGLALVLFSRAAWVSLKVLRFGRLEASTEGALALEKQSELAATFAKAGALAASGGLLLSAFAADRLAPSLRGAMCGYGTIHAHPAGAYSLSFSAAASWSAAVFWLVQRFDLRLRENHLRKALAALTIGVTLLAALDASYAYAWLHGLDFSIVTSCCSSSADGASGAVLARGMGQQHRSLAAVLALAAGGASAALLWAGKRSRSRLNAIALFASSLAALPLGLWAISVHIAPHIYEVPNHTCPYCLLKSEAYGLGYPLFIGLFLVTALGAAASLCRLLPAGPTSSERAGELLRSWSRSGAVLWLMLLALASAPLIRYRVVSGGASLF